MFDPVEFYVRIAKTLEKYQIQKFEGQHTPPEDHTVVSMWVTPQSYTIEYAPTALLSQEIIDLAHSKEQECRPNGWSVVTDLSRL